MRNNEGLCARGKWRFKAATNSAHDLLVALNKVWTGDITYIWTEESWL